MKSHQVLLIVIATLISRTVFSQQFFNLALITTHKNDENLFFLNENDGGISGINSVPVFQCTSIITPMVLIENYGNNTLTSATIQYFLDGGLPQLFYWSGNLAPYFTDTIFLPSMEVTDGNHVLTVQVTQANGESDFNNANNESVEFNIVGNGIPVPYQESFTSLQLPAGYFIDNENNGPAWEVFENPMLNGSYYHSLRMPFYINDVTADVDDLYTINFDLTDASAPQLSFNIAYAYYSEEYWDKLQVQVSSDCGNNWEVIYDKAKDELATAGFTDVPFVPLQSQWRNESIDLSQYADVDALMVRFEATSGHGNNLYIDNIAIDENTGIENWNATSFKCFPNPANDLIEMNLPENFKGEIKIVNAFGQVVFEKSIRISSKIIIPLSNLAAGKYFITTFDERNFSLVQKIVVLH
ncbi:MAG: T9SS type A sorting domain-containing protein [Chitinophagales bacterium]|nr:T9SS type A sorting domain-containing protein [Chitinophagales bacterium]